MKRKFSLYVPLSYFHSAFFAFFTLNYRSLLFPFLSLGFASFCFVHTVSHFSQRKRIEPENGQSVFKIIAHQKVNRTESKYFSNRNDPNGPKNYLRKSIFTVY